MGALLMQYINKETFQVERKCIAYGYYFDSYKTIDGDRAGFEPALTELYIGRADVMFQSLVLQADFSNNEHYTKNRLLGSIFASAIVEYQSTYDLLSSDEEEKVEFELCCENPEYREFEYKITRYYLADGEHYIDIAEGLDKIYPETDYVIFYGKVNAVVRILLSIITEESGAIENKDSIITGTLVENFITALHEDSPDVETLLEDGVTIDINEQGEEERMSDYNIFYTLKAVDRSQLSDNSIEVKI